MSFEQVLGHIISLKPDLRNSIQGCSEEEVARLEAIRGAPLLPVYRQFLLAMGHESGFRAFYAGGFIWPDANYSYKRVLTLEKRAKVRWPARLTLVGQVEDDPHETICIDAGESLNEERVIRHDAGWNEAVVNEVLAKSEYFDVALSFQEMLFATAFVNFVFPQYPWELSNPTDRRGDAATRQAKKLLLHIGFQQHPGSSGWTSCFTRHDAVAIVYQNRCGPLDVCVRARTKEVAQRLATAMREELGDLIPKNCD
jgi:hypothetical protein